MFAMKQKQGNYYGRSYTIIFASIRYKSDAHQYRRPTQREFLKSSNRGGQDPLRDFKHQPAAASQDEQ